MIDVAKALLRTIEKEGIVIVDKEDVYKTLDEAIQSGCFSFIEKDGKNVGFFTWKRNEDMSIFFNNMLIFKQYRGTINLRKYFKKFFSVYGAYTWKNRKHQRDVYIQGGTLCLQPA